MMKDIRSGGKITCDEKKKMQSFPLENFRPARECSPAGSRATIAENPWHSKLPAATPEDLPRICDGLTILDGMF